MSEYRQLFSDPNETFEDHTDAPAINWLGRLDGQGAAGVPDRAIWTGNISATDVRPSTRTKSEIKERLPYFYVPVDLTASERCGDGRGVLDVKNPANLGHILELPLGPQSFGGTSANGYPYRLANGHFDSRDLNAADDVLRSSFYLDEASVVHSVGGHRDEHALPGRIGCGYLDKYHKKIRRVTSPSALPSIYTLSQSIAEPFVRTSTFEEIFAEIIEETRILADHDMLGSYLSKEGSHYTFRNIFINDVEEIGGEESVPTVIGKHNEFAVAVNFKEGLTLNNTLLAHDTADQAQVFGVDAWWPPKKAEGLFGYDPRKKDKFIIASAIDTVATAMVLTDGSQELAVVQ